jgi:zinc/manganese transport system substrate-binding protein
MKALLGVLLFGFTCLAAFCADAAPLRVVTLSTVLTEIAQQVGGENVKVDGIVRPGIDPHAFDPSAADMRALTEADLVLASGLQLDSYPDRLVTQFKGKGAALLVGARLPISLTVSQTNHLEFHHDSKSASGEIDPHWWHSLENVSLATDLVRDELTKLRPSLGEQFAARASAYHTRLSELKSWADTEFRQVPPAERYLITSHDAFGYLAHDYGFEVHAISGLSTEGEPNAKHLAALIDLIRRKKIRAVFAENNVNPSVIANLVAETGVKLGGTLHADGLGPSDSDASTYEAMYRHNVRTIVEGLR